MKTKQNKKTFFLNSVFNTKTVFLKVYAKLVYVKKYTHNF